jgi:hypothetical protein
VTLTVQVQAADEAASGVVAEDDAALQKEEAFDEAIIDYGMLAGAVRSCIKEDEAKLTTHETRAFDIYSRITRAFGTDRSFKFAAAYGYGAAEGNEEAECAELIDQFEDKYGVVAAEYGLVDKE